MKIPTLLTTLRTPGGDSPSSRRSGRRCFELTARATLFLLVMHLSTGLIGTRAVEAYVPPSSGIGFDAATGVVTIAGTTGNDVATAAWSTRPSLRVTRGTSTATFSAVTKIVFNGYAGKDSFTNDTSIPSVVDGGDGDDLLNGGSGNDIIKGGNGHDTIYGKAGDDALSGGGGSDTMYGGDGNDVMKGDSGVDEIHGEFGDDSLYGGSDNDSIYGESGFDLIVTIGGGTDAVAGGPHWDNFWVDTSDAVADTSAAENQLGYVHEVENFFAVSYDGGGLSTPIGKELNGANLPDPLPYATHTDLSLENFAGYPLFASSGPSKDDIFQGSVGDCFILAPLSAAADAHPEGIRKLVADLGDGTYAVRFYRDGQPQYVRVDADLWVTASGKPKYARLGQENSIWVPIVEKAYAFFRTQQGNYPSLASGNGSHHGHFNATWDRKVIDDGITAVQVMAWVGQGWPSGTIKNTIKAGVVDLLNWIAQAQANGEAVYTGARSGVSDTMPLQVEDPFLEDDQNTYRSGEHQYMIDHVEFDALGQPAALVLRDPYGKPPITLTDFTHIYFCLGRAVIWRLP